MSVDDARAVAPVFDAARLKLAREVRGLKKSELALRVGITPAAIGQFESGAAKPKASTLAEVALVLQFPVGFFAYTGEPVRQPDVGDTFFRSLRRTKQIDRQRAIAFATLVALLLDKLEQHLDLPEVDIPDELHVSEDASLEEVEEIAHEMRRRWEIPAGPLKHVVRLLEARGIAVVRYSGGEDIDAFSAWFPSRPIVVLAADKDNFERSRLDAAHELGHLVMHADPAPGDRILERQAYRFASALLMPREDIIRDLPTQTVNWQNLVSMKQTWGVSMQALLYRARNLGTLSEARFENAMRTMSRRGWRRREPGHVRPPEQPRLLAASIEKLDEIGINSDDLASHTDLGRPMLDDLVGSTAAREVTL